MKRAHSHLADVLKIDLDFIPPVEWFREWLFTRAVLLKLYDIEIKKVNVCTSSSGKGLHIWLHIDRKIGDEEKAKLQFLLGDDHRRSAYNNLRVTYFRPYSKLFDVLFNYKFSDSL